MKRLLVLCSLFLFLPVASRAAPTTYIGEVAWAGSNASTSDEWLELCGSPGTDLSGWTIDGAGTGGTALALPSGSAVPASGAFLVANYGSDDPRSTLAAGPDFVTTAVALSNSALFLTLRDADGAAVDAAGASGTPPLAGASGAIKASMERLFPIGDGGKAESWVSASASAGFDAGAVELGTPGSCPTTPASADEPATETPIVSAARPDASDAPSAPAPSVSTGPTSAVRISEAFPAPKSGEHEWIELTDPSDVGEVLDGWTIEDGKGTATPLAGTLLPWSRVVVESPKGQLNNDGDLIVLKDPSGRVIDAVAYGLWDSPYPDVGEVRKGESLIRLELQDAFTVTTTPTPGEANVLTERAEAPKAPAPSASETAPITSSSTPVPAPTRQAASPAPSATIAVAPPARAIVPAAKKPSAPAAKGGSASGGKYKGLGYVGVVASPPGIYSKTRLFALIDGEVRDVHLSKAPDATYLAGARISFVAQEKSDGGDPYLLANPNSIRLLDASASATFATIESWPDRAGAYRLNAEVVSMQTGVLEAKLGGVEGDILAPAALTASLKPGDVVAIEGYVSPGPRPRAVLARPEALTLFKAYQSEATPKAPAAKLPWPVTIGLTLLTALVGLYAYLRHQRLQRLALVLSPVDAEDEN